MLADLRQTWRALLRNPGYAAVATLALGFGIGTATAGYSACDALLFRPIDVPELHRLVMLFSASEGARKSLLAPADYFDYRREVRSLEHMAAYRFQGFNLTGAGEPVRVDAARATASFFRAMRVQPLAGRVFVDEEETPGQDRVAVLGHGLWTRSFGADPRVIGRTISLDGQSHVVIGIMPPSFLFPPPAELWLPLALEAKEAASREFLVLGAMGRLKPGVSVGEAEAELKTIARRLAGVHPDTNALRSAAVAPLAEYVSSEETGRYSKMSLYSVVFLLLLACANVANLIFARGTRRTREMAVRAALGAGRARLVVLFMTESVLLSFCGALVGLLVAAWSLDLIRGGMNPDVERYLPGWRNIGIDGRALAWMLLTALSSGLLTGVGPALMFSKASLAEGLKEGGRSLTAGKSRHRLRSLLVVTEVVLAVVLLVCAGLMASGFGRIAEPLPNMAPEEALTARVALPLSRYATPERRLAFQEQVLAQLKAAAEVRTAALVSNLPYSGGRATVPVEVEGAAAEPGTRPAARRQSISEDYFRTMHIPLRRGRPFDNRDGRDSAAVAVVSDAFVRRYLPDRDPLGRRFRMAGPGAPPAWLTVVGVVADVRHVATEREPGPEIYLPFRQFPPQSVEFVLRASGDPTVLVTAVRAAVGRADPDQPVSKILTLRKLIDNHLLGYKYVAVMMSVVGLIAFVLAATGVYSVMSYSVGERTHEIGVRLAVGASDGDVLKMVVGGALKLVGGGILIGLAAAAGLARAFSSFIFGVGAYDPLTFGGVVILLAATAIIAAYIPARRATRLDPVATLRAE